MAGKQLVWDVTGEHTYQIGIDHVALYPQKEDGSYPQGYAWNGVTAVTESPSGAEANDIYADNIKYLSIRSKEDLGLTIECYDTPEAFDACDGCGSPADTEVKGVTVSQQSRQSFGLSYRTQLGNDTKGDEYGYELHLVYGCTASPSEVAHNTINDSPEPGTLSYEITTLPVAIPGMKASSHITINSLKADKAKLADLEKKLYGDEATDPMLPLPEEVFSTLKTDSE